MPVHGGQQPLQQPQYAPQHPWAAPTDRYGAVAHAGPSGQPPWPQPAPARRGRLPWVLAALAAVLVVTVVAGFAFWHRTSSSSAGNVSNLDVGRYGTQPRKLPGSPTEDESRALEAYRLAEGLVDPYEVDPLLDHVYGLITPDSATAATLISGTATPLTKPVMDKYGMISGYSVRGVSKRLRDFARDKTADLVLIVMVTSYPSDDAAARAAAEMDSVDFAVNPENRGLIIPGYPQAKAHYRPGSPSLGSTMASGRVVISMAVRSDSNPDVSHLTQEIQRTLELQVPLLNNLITYNGLDLKALALDPDHMLVRGFTAGDQLQISNTFGSIGPHAAALCADAQALKDGLFARAGIDRCAFSRDFTLLRARDEAAAKTFLPELIEANRGELIDHEVAAPQGVPGARCYEQKEDIVADNANGRFACTISYGRYVSTVWSNEEKDVRQRAASQYAILVNAG